MVLFIRHAVLDHGEDDDKTKRFVAPPTTSRQPAHRLASTGPPATPTGLRPPAYAHRLTPTGLRPPAYAHQHTPTSTRPPAHARRFSSTHPRLLVYAHWPKHPSLPTPAHANERPARAYRPTPTGARPHPHSWPALASRHASQFTILAQHRHATTGYAIGQEYRDHLGAVVVD
jgi:hypothetical protein